MSIAHLHMKPIHDYVCCFSSPASWRGSSCSKCSTSCHCSSRRSCSWRPAGLQRSLGWVLQTAGCLLWTGRAGAWSGSCSTAGTTGSTSWPIGLVWYCSHLNRQQCPVVPNVVVWFLLLRCIHTARFQVLYCSLLSFLKFLQQTSKNAQFNKTKQKTSNYWSSWFYLKRLKLSMPHLVSSWLQHLTSSMRSVGLLVLAAVAVGNIPFQDIKCSTLLSF